MGGEVPLPDYQSIEAVVIKYAFLFIKRLVRYVGECSHDSLSKTGGASRVLYGEFVSGRPDWGPHRYKAACDR